MISLFKRNCALTLAVAMMTLGTGCVKTVEDLKNDLSHNNYSQSTNYEDVLEYTKKEDVQIGDAWYYAPAKQCSEKSQLTCAVQLRSLNNEIFQAYVDHETLDDYGWSFFHSATDENKNFKLHVIDRHAFSALNEVFLNETVAVSISKNYLIQHIDKGVNIRLVGKNHDNYITLPPYYISAFLKKIEQ